MEINLGGQAFPQHIKDEDHRTQFGIVHMQARFVENQTKGKLYQSLRC